MRFTNVSGPLHVRMVLLRRVSLQRRVFGHFDDGFAEIIAL